MPGFQNSGGGGAIGSSGGTGTIDFGSQEGLAGAPEIQRRQRRLVDLLAGAGTRDELVGTLTNARGLGGKDRNIARAKTEIGRAGVLAEGFRVRDENEKRRQEAKKFLLASREKNLRPSITEDDINTRFAAEADRASQLANDNFDFLSSALGSAGITGGGLAAGLGTNVELERVGQVTNAKRDLAIFKAQSDAQDALRNIQFDSNIASFLADEADETGLAVMAEILGVDMSVYGRELAHKEARDAAKAATQGAALGLVGQIAGAGIGAL